MGRGGIAEMTRYPILALRTHFCKILIVVILIFVFIQYGTHVMVYKGNIQKMISPGLSWFSFRKTLKFDGTIASTKVVNQSGTNTNMLISPKHVSNRKNFRRPIALGMGRKIKNASRYTDCPLVPPNLVGALKVLREPTPFEELEKMFIFLDPGGRWKPKECRARHKVAIIIPYRDREEHLRIFLHNMHPILQRQQLDYGIYVIEEAPNMKFNRAMLMNIGYAEALKQYDYDCFIFHDVDLIPEDDRNLYTCPEQPRHMSVAINTMNYRLPYKDIFGGVSALTKKHMMLLNGFSNEFWGWGGEDDDMSNRIRYHGLKITRYSSKIARYTMLKHHKDEPNPERYNKLYKGKYRFKKDGLSNLKYSRLDLVLKKLFTWVLVKIDHIK